MKKIYLIVIGIFISAFSYAQCPTITCPANISINNDSGICGAVVNFTPPVGTDPCGTTTQTFNYTGSIDTWTVPAGVTSVTIETRGAQGGYNTNSTTSSGLGAIMIGTFSVVPGTQLKILVGQQPSASAGNGGGGGTFVTDMSNNPLIIAGGGGGSSQSTDSPDKHGQAGTSGGNGAAGGGMGGTAGSGGGIGASGFQSGAGGGLLTNGADGWSGGTGGLAFISGGSGGTTNAPANGGFGGGGSGSSYVVGGGGGGYSGGGSGGNSTAGVGGGGGSYNAGTSQNNTGGANSGNGLVIISYNGGGIVTTTQIAGLASGATFPVGTTTQTFQVDDGLGNTATCSFTVTVNDTEAPVFASCPSNVSSCNATVTAIAPGTATDNCTATPTITYLLSGATTGTGNNDASGTVFNTGTTTVLYVAMDSNGNSDSCSFIVSIEDLLAPTFTTCHSDTSTCSPLVNNISPGTATDNCAASPVVTYLFSGATSGSGNNDASGNTFNVGTTLVQYIAADDFGNTDTCSFNVTIYPIPTVIASTADSVACINNAAISLTGTPVSGTWSGSGVTGATFTPTAAGFGTHVLIYSFTSADGCTNSDSTQITVLGCAGITESPMDGINIYPNPTSDYVTVDLLKPYELVEVKVGDLSGKNLATYTLQSQQKITIGLQELPSGVYFINVITVNGAKIFRIVKK
jgi:hypothetical protein